MVTSGVPQVLAFPALRRHLACPQAFAADHVCPEAANYVRALAVLPASVTLPKGGFAAGSSDKAIRVYTRAGDIVRTLEGHSGGVLSLSVAPDGSLVSGSWDGSAKVWNVDSGACTATLGGMENAITVLCLPNGDVVAGETMTRLHVPRSECPLPPLPGRVCLVSFQRR